MAYLRRMLQKTPRDGGDVQAGLHFVYDEHNAVPEAVTVRDRATPDHAEGLKKKAKTKIAISWKEGSLLAAKSAQLPEKIVAG